MRNWLKTLLLVTIILLPSHAQVEEKGSSRSGRLTARDWTREVDQDSGFMMYNHTYTIDGNTVHFRVYQSLTGNRPFSLRESTNSHTHFHMGPFTTLDEAFTQVYWWVNIYENHPELLR